jgi:hypothetical protein
VTIKRALEDVPIDPAAEERAWAVVSRAYRDRVSVPQARRRWPVVAVALAAVVLAAVLSPPGRAVVDALRRSIGVSHAAPALFRLPAQGRLLVSGAGGTWVVSADGSRRRLGPWRQAAWSPHGKFVVGAGGNELAAVEPSSGNVRWSLARRGVSSPTWGGTKTDTRILYLARGGPRIVGGDGRGDSSLTPQQAVLVAWRPEHLEYAMVSRLGGVFTMGAGRLEIRGALGIVSRPRAIGWAPDGHAFAVATPKHVVVYRGGTNRVLDIKGVRALAYSRNGRLAVMRRNSIAVVGGSRARTIFTSAGRLDGLAWSPDGRWLVTSAPDADQWIFVHGARVLAVSNIAKQFGGAVSLDGWAPGT